MTTADTHMFCNPTQLNHVPSIVCCQYWVCLLFLEAFWTSVCTKLRHLSTPPTKPLIERVIAYRFCSFLFNINLHVDTGIPNLREITYILSATSQLIFNWQWEPYYNIEIISLTTVPKFRLYNMLWLLHPKQGSMEYIWCMSAVTTYSTRAKSKGYM